MAATPITFDAFLGWVDATDPANIPADIRTITAADLIRYEKFGQDAAARLNSLTTFMDGAPAAYAPVAGSPNYAPATGSAAYAPATGSTAYADKSVETSKENSIPAGSAGQYWNGDKTWQTLNKAAVGLGAVDNTADSAKPVSIAQQAALDKLSRGAIAASGQITVGAGVNNTWVTAAMTSSVTLVAGRWYRVFFTTAQSAAEANMAFALQLRKSAVSDTSPDGTDMSDTITAYTAPFAQYGKTTQGIFEFRASSTETVNLKVCAIRASGASTINLANRSMVLHDEGAQF